MLDKTINGHLDKMEILEERLTKDIDAILKEIDIKKIINNPKAALLEITDGIREMITIEYAPLALEEGARFAQVIKTLIEKGDDITIQKTKDANLNAES